MTEDEKLAEVILQCAFDFVYLGKPIKLSAIDKLANALARHRERSEENDEPR